METIAPMTLPELEMVLDWAAAEGWNPGLADAAAFHAADPEGFLLKKVNGAPAAAISVVNHSPAFAFLGLYIAAPAFRGQGHGWDIWQAGLAHAGTRTVGLDGVPAQQANYARSGFAAAGRTIRYSGRAAPTGSHETRSATEDDLAALLHHDSLASGVTRQAYMKQWLSAVKGRRTAILESAGHLAYATVRDCREGCKIGPLAAETEDSARALLGALSEDRPVLVDVPESSPALIALLEREGFEPVFETARMYLGPAPAMSPPRYSAITTLELG